MAETRALLGMNSPAWLGPSLFALGALAWTGAGALAHAQSRAPAPDQASASEPTPSDAEEEPPPAVQILPDPAPTAAPTPPPGVPQACAPAVELTFANGAAAVDQADRLRAIVSAAAAFPERKVVVEGHASASGPASTNLQLSHRRARRAKAKLVAEGLDAERITVQAFGEYRPNVDGDEARDRRVIVKIEGIATCPDQAAEE